MYKRQSYGNPLSGSAILTGSGTLILGKTASVNIGGYNAVGTNFTGTLILGGPGTATNSLAAVGAAGGINIPSGTLNIASGGTAFQTYNNSQNLIAGALTGSGNVTATASHLSTALWTVGGANLNTTYSGNMAAGTIATSFTKVGTGTQTFLGVNAWTVPVLSLIHI